MSRSICRFALAGVLFLILLTGMNLSANAQTATAEKTYQTAEGVVRELYNLVTTPKGGALPDWDKVRSLFLKDAVIVLRTTREATTVFSLQGFIDDFVFFNERARVKERGFTERIIRLKPMVFHDMANVLVLYEASMTDSTRPPQQGVDSFHLIRKDGRWWIASILNDLPTPEIPIPQELQK
jgi:hypothetical protein